MPFQFAALARLALAAIAIAGFSAGSSNGVEAFSFSSAEKPLFTVAAERANPPPGWAEFCTRYVSECDVKPNTKQSVPRTIVLSSETWETITEVNEWVNTHIQPVPDRVHRGRINVWGFAEDGRGDCKDYVLVKRQKLIEAGLPRESLLITVVWTSRGQGHVVLIAHTDRGDFVLDNLSPMVVIWSKTPYEFVERQSELDPDAWVYIDGRPPRSDELWMAHGLI